MKILEIKTLAIPEIKVIRFARFWDHRGYLTEHFRKSDFKNNPDLEFLKNLDFMQSNESYSRAKVFRGFHFQWNPYMGKLVRPLSGHLIDMGMDIRKNSPTFGKIVTYDMPVSRNNDYDEWIWIPPGFAHGVIFPEESLIEYFCSGEYSPGCEGGISPMAKDIDWSLCAKNQIEQFNEIISTTELLSDKDKASPDLKTWLKDERSNNFIYGKI